MKVLDSYFRMLASDIVLFCIFSSFFGLKLHLSVLLVSLNFLSIVLVDCFYFIFGFIV